MYSRKNAKHRDLEGARCAKVLFLFPVQPQHTDEDGTQTQDLADDGAYGELVML